MKFLNDICCMKIVVESDKNCMNLVTNLERYVNFCFVLYILNIDTCVIT